MTSRAMRVARPLRPTDRTAFAAIAVLLLLRLLLIPVTVLIPEEAYYWMYSKYPALGYLDHPPMVAWLIAAGTSVFGATELGVRIGTWLLAIGSAWLCYRLVADWSGRRAGITAALVFSITPLFCGTGFLATPDAPLLSFWLFALLAVTRDCPLGDPRRRHVGMLRGGPGEGRRR